LAESTRFDSYWVMERLDAWFRPSMMVDFTPSK
jgi:hypothetical protein